LKQDAAKKLAEVPKPKSYKEKIEGLLIENKERLEQLNEDVRFTSFLTKCLEEELNEAIKTESK
jgi:hypothetical protein